MRNSTEDPLPDLLADIEELAGCESPSTDLHAAASSADVVARLGERRLGVAPERIVLDGRTHLRWRLGPGPPRVWPLGSPAIHPYTVDGGVLRGPGCFDKKAAVGGGAHADDEHALIAELPGRFALIRALITDLLSRERMP